jgi:hypothetical protein
VSISLEELPSCGDFTRLKTKTKSPTTLWGCIEFYSFPFLSKTLRCLRGKQQCIYITFTEKTVRVPTTDKTIKMHRNHFLISGLTESISGESVHQRKAYISTTTFAKYGWQANSIP